MTSAWTSFLESESSEANFPPFKELYAKSPTEKTLQTQKQLEIYLNLFSQGRSLLHNLRDRKEFYRPDLYEHLYEATMKKEQIKKANPASSQPNKGEEIEELKTETEEFRANKGGLKLCDLV